MTIAIEFDGVIVEDNFPFIGEERAFAFDTIKHLQNDGHELVLWTRRHGKALDDAITFCLEHGVKFYAVNQTYPEERMEDPNARKINAEIFIENRMPAALPDWGAIYQMISDGTFDQPYDPENPGKQNKSFIQKLFKL